MKVLNIHTRIIKQPITKVAPLLKTLSLENDKIWPKEKWPEMRFKNGMSLGAKGGHGPIRYFVETYHPTNLIQFRFLKPNGFNGIHKFEITEVPNNETEISHTIDMHTSGKTTWKWLFIIRPMHNALIEDGFDKLENNFSVVPKTTKWSFWVRFIRNQIAKKNRG